MIKRSLAVFLIATVLLLSGCQRGSTEQFHKRTAVDLFDTVCTFTAGGDKDDFDQTADLLFEKLSELDSLFDIYEQAEEKNNLYTVNEMAGVAPVETDPLLVDFFLYVNALPSELTSLAHPMMGALTLLWKDAQEQGVPPTKEAILQASLHIDPSSLQIDPDAMTLYISDPEARIDVGAFAKGYAAKVCIDLLEEQQVDNYMLSLGGSVYVKGVNPATDAPWIVGIQDPDRTEDAALFSLQVPEGSITTTGTYRRYFSYEGTHYHHIIDPATGIPSSRCDTLSLTVTAADPALGDLLSTVLFILPPSEGSVLLEKEEIAALDPHLSALWIDSNGNVTKTQRFPERTAPVSHLEAVLTVTLLSLLILAVLILLLVQKKETVYSFFKDHPHFFSRKNIVFLFLVLLSCFLMLCALFLLPQSSAKVVTIRYKGQVVKTMPLDEDTDYVFLCSEGENLIRVEGRRVFVVSATCHGQDCVHTQALDESRSTSVIACLPHSLTITLEQGERYE